MTNPDTETIINYFLYGQSSDPSNKATENLIRSDSISKVIPIDAVEYMTSGAGRFALAASSQVVNRFFSSMGDVIPARAEAYSLSEILTFFGLPDQGRNISVQQHYYQDGQDDYGERVLINGSTSYRIAPEAKFYVPPVGERYIDDLAVLPFDDNFDFESNDLAAIVGNALSLKREWPAARH